LLGPNGAGKTTLMKLIAGLSRPDSGQLAIFGQDSARERQAIKPVIALVAQDNNLEREFTVQEALLTYARLYGIVKPRQRVAAIVNEFNLTDMLGKRVAVLSGGMARRLLIARALLPEPRLLLLDEPTVGLDPDVRHTIWALVRRLAAAGTTVFMTTHYMEEAEQLCRRVALLKAGRVVVVDTPAGLKVLAEAGTIAGESPTLETAFLRLIREGRA
jgi:ABC-type multidrug transport system ATPase subunit